MITPAKIPVVPILANDSSWPTVTVVLPPTGTTSSWMGI
ncbi:MAG: hypothetical protein K0R86_2081, partial [Enterobacter kobei]|nr:hypothetical protein [Enterobacter kobei]